ncbi:MAG: hypothetical protein RR968_01800 [Vagococcus sp.]
MRKKYLLPIIVVLGIVSIVLSQYSKVFPYVTILMGICQLVVIKIGDSSDVGSSKFGKVITLFDIIGGVAFILIGILLIISL